MSPERALEIMRKSASALLSVLEGPTDDAEHWPPEVEDLVESVIALDEWLSRGGFMPPDWR